jgi:hypothetical protein
VNKDPGADRRTLGAGRDHVEVVNTMPLREVLLWTGTNRVLTCSDVVGGPDAQDRFGLDGLNASSGCGRGRRGRVARRGGEGQNGS